MTDDRAFTVGSIRDHVDNLGVHIATWAERSTPAGNPAERQALIEAVQDIDAAGRLLIDLRGALAAEIQPAGADAFADGDVFTEQV